MAEVTPSGVVSDHVAEVYVAVVASDPPVPPNTPNLSLCILSALSGVIVAQVAVSLAMHGRLTKEAQNVIHRPQSQPIVCSADAELIYPQEGMVTGRNFGCCGWRSRTRCCGATAHVVQDLPSIMQDAFQDWAVLRACSGLLSVLNTRVIASTSRTTRGLGR